MGNPLSKLLNRHTSFENEQVHVLTILYGITCSESERETHLEIARSLELMKSATLIIDDFLDHSEERNGLPSVYAEHGPEEAVLIGEILKTSASLAFQENVNKLKTVPRTKKYKAIRLFEETYRTICCGQLEDLRIQSEPVGDKSLGQKRFFNMITQTSAVFIQFPVVLGALLNKTSEAQMQALGKYGINLGLAYQIRDDVIDLIGDPSLTGKPYAGDLREKKKRLPLVYGWKVASEKERKRITKCFEEPAPLDEKTVEELANLLRKLGAEEYCMDMAKRYCSKAIRALKGVPSTRKRRQLEDVAYLLATFEGRK